MRLFLYLLSIATCTFSAPSFSQNTDDAELEVTPGHASVIITEYLTLYLDTKAEELDHAVARRQQGAILEGDYHTFTLEQLHCKQDCIEALRLELKKALDEITLNGILYEEKEYVEAINEVIRNLKKNTLALSSCNCR